MTHQDPRGPAHHPEPPSGAPRRAEGDELPPELAAAVAALRRLPTVSPGATTRIVAAATGQRTDRRAFPWRWSVAPRRAIAAAAVLAVAIGSASVLRGRAGAAAARVAERATDVVPAAETAVPALVPVAASAAALDEAPRPVAFVLHRPGAQAVSLVGDFNGWGAEPTPLASAGSGVWTVTVPLTPGRHAYGFVVDGETWVLDPQAPAARDSDYGRDHSVVVVGVQ